MKSIVINDVVYSVGDEAYLIKRDTDLSKVGVRNYKDCINKIIITKITSSGYVYVKGKAQFATEFKLNKDGSYGTYRCPTYPFSTYPLRVLTPYSEEIENILNRCEMKHNYIQNTFQRLKLITSLSYTNAQKINAVLDEIGIDKVEEE
jgi:hypothetical protein